MGKTPITDALLNTTYIGDGTHFVDLARKLETDRAELVEALKKCCDAIEQEVSQGSDGADTHPIVLAHAKVAKSARALLARLEADK